MDKSLITNLENKIENLCAITAVSSVCDFSNLNDEVQASFLNAVSSLSLEVKDGYQAVIEQLIKNN